MPTRHGGSLPKNSITWPRLNCFLSTGLSEASTPCTWKTFLARSIPIVLICMWTAPSCDSSLTITLWHIDAGSGRRPPHQKRLLCQAACHVCSLSESRLIVADLGGRRVPAREGRQG